LPESSSAYQTIKTEKEYLMRRAFRYFLFITLLLLPVGMQVQAQEIVQVTSQPDEVGIFYNGIASVRDTMQLPTGGRLQIALPAGVYPQTLIVRENNQRVMDYRLIQDSRLLLEWDSPISSTSREVTLQYLMSGLGWTPKYDMFITGQDATTVDFDFFAEIHNTSLTADAVKVSLIAGNVGLGDMYAPEFAAAAPAMNQAIAGYAEVEEQASLTGGTTIQYIYEVGTIALDATGTRYVGLLSTPLPVRKVNLWNANYDSQVYAIYKVKNEATIPFADGLVHSYQDNMFLGTDGLELTPVGSEGSVTVGTLQNVRVNRTENRTSVNSLFYSYDVDVTLELNNYSDTEVTIDVVDYYPSGGRDYVFTTEPETQGDNLYRWTVTIPAGETVKLTYKYKV
jgi:hypothetical protein